MSALPSPVPEKRSASSQAKLAARRQKLIEQEGRQHLRSVGKSQGTPPTPTPIWESGTKLSINLLIIGTAVVTLFNLMPDQLTQRSKLKQLRAEENLMKEQVESLQNYYQRSQDQDVAQKIAEEHGYLVRPSQQQIILIDNQQKI